MLFSIVVLVTALSSSAYASPMLLKRCDVKGCALALGSAAFDCGGAAVQEGFNPINDAACVAQVVGDTASPPPECSGCASDALNDVESTFGNIVGSLF